jgi:hypothetical protein
MDIDLLMEASIDRADAILAVTDDDKTNLLVAVRAKQAGCPMTIALVNDPTLAPLMAPLDIDAYINPRATTVSSILRHIRHGRVRAVYSIGDAEAEMIEAQVLNTSPLAGRLVRDIEFPEGVLVGAVMKGDKVLKPTGDLRIETGDVIALFSMAKRRARGRAPPASLDRLLLMLARLAELPLLVVLLGVSGRWRFLPALLCAGVDHEHAGRDFLYSALILLVGAVMLGIATAAYSPRAMSRSHLAALVLAYACPAVRHGPAHDRGRARHLDVNAWFEMISAFTTTGASVYPPDRLPDAVHLWRATVGWFGGYLTHPGAYAILAPLNLGGAEVSSGRVPGRGLTGVAQIARASRSLPNG